MRLPLTFLLFNGTGDLDRDLDRGFLLLLMVLEGRLSPGNSLASTFLILLITDSGFCMPEELGLLVTFCCSLAFVLFELSEFEAEDLPLLFSYFRLSNLVLLETRNDKTY